MTEKKVPVRERLIEAGKNLFVEHGFERVSLAEIAEKADCSRSGVNVHFEGKQDLIEAILRRELADLDKTVPQPSGDLEADLIRLAQNYHAFYSERPFLFLGLLECSRDKELRKVLIELQEFTFTKLTLLYGTYRDKDWWEPTLRYFPLGKINNAISSPFLGGIFAPLFLAFVGLVEAERFDATLYVRRFLSGYVSDSKRSQVRPTVHIDEPDAHSNLDEPVRIDEPDTHSSLDEPIRIDEPDARGDFLRRQPKGQQKAKRSKPK